TLPRAPRFQMPGLAPAETGQTAGADHNQLAVAGPRAGRCGTLPSQQGFAALGRPVDVRFALRDRYPITSARPTTQPTRCRWIRRPGAAPAPGTVITPCAIRSRDKAAPRVVSAP